MVDSPATRARRVYSEPPICFAEPDFSGRRRRVGKPDAARADTELEERAGEVYRVAPDEGHPRVEPIAGARERERLASREAEEDRPRHLQEGRPVAALPHLAAVEIHTRIDREQAVILTI